MKIDFTAKPTFAVRPQTRTMIVPIRIMEPPGPRRRIPDLTKEANQNADNLKSLLVYPSTSNFPSELKPIVLPGGHYKLERLKKPKKPQEKVT